MKYAHRLVIAVLMVMGFSATAVAAGDIYDPYVTADEIMATPSGFTDAEQRMSDHYDPFILSSEIIVKEGCPSSVVHLVSDQYDPYFTVADLNTAKANNKC